MEAKRRNCARFGGGLSKYEDNTVPFGWKSPKNSQIEAKDHSNH